MIKKTALCMLLFIFILGVSSFAFEEKECIIDGFNNYKWGTSIDEIMKNEVNDSMIESKDYIYQNDTLTIIDGEVAGYDCYVYYFFDDKQLTDGMYYITETHSDPEKYYDDFARLSSKYRRVYGSPKESNELWEDDHKYDIDQKGHAVKNCELTILYTWSDENGNTINLILTNSKSDDEPYCAVKYESTFNVVKDNSNLNGI